MTDPSAGAILRGETIADFDWSDADLWPEDPDGGGYVHSLAVRPAFHCHQAGGAMLRWAAEHVHTRGRRRLRLDCVADNWALRRYYEGLGFCFRGLASYEGYVGARFELALDQSRGQPVAARGPTDTE